MKSAIVRHILVKDKELAESLHQKSLNYINGFIISLLRTTHNEQEKFFVLIQQNKDFIQKLLPFMNRFNRFVCRNPDFSRYLAACMRLLTRINVSGAGAVRSRALLPL